MRKTLVPVEANATRSIHAPKEAVWNVLDDFPGISAWSAGIERSYTTGDRQTVTGLGAQRRCELGGKMILDERISAYIPGDSMTIDVWNVEGLPLESSRVTFSVRSTGPASSEVSILAVATPRLPGPIVGLLRPVLSSALTRNFAGLLEELAGESERKESAA